MPTNVLNVFEIVIVSLIHKPSSVYCAIGSATEWYVSQPTKKWDKLICTSTDSEMRR